MDGLRKIVLEPRPKGRNYEARKVVQAEAYFWRASSATKEIGLGSLGNGIGSTGQAQEIPDNQEHDSDKLRKRRGEVEQPAP